MTNAVIYKNLNIARKNLENVTAQAKRRLFEFETLESMYEISTGKSKTFKNAKNLMKSL